MLDLTLAEIVGKTHGSLGAIHFDVVPSVEAWDLVVGLVVRNIGLTSGHGTYLDFAAAVVLDDLVSGFESTTADDFGYGVRGVLFLRVG